MRQTVTITRAADRHAEDHARDFAESYQAEVRADFLEGVFAQLSEKCSEHLDAMQQAPGRYDITISEPYE